jgi:membrane-associated phospholipid phosphatase
MISSRWLHGGCSFALAALLSVGSASAQTTRLVPPDAHVATAPSTSPEASIPAAQPSLPSVQPSAPSWSQLFKSTAGDLRRLRSQDALTWLTIGAAASAVAHTGDARVTTALAGAGRYHETFESGALIGNMLFQTSGALGTYAIGRMTGSPQVASVGADLFRAQLLSQVITQAIKMSSQRTRPDGSSFSFPSGHTASSFATATVLQRHFGWKAGIPAYAVATYVAASRVEARRHFLSDVAFGAALGIVAGRTVTVGRGDARFAVAPMAAPGGGGVAFTWVGHDR